MSPVYSAVEKRTQFTLSRGVDVPEFLPPCGLVISRLGFLLGFPCRVSVAMSPQVLQVRPPGSGRKLLIPEEPPGVAPHPCDSRHHLCLSPLRIFSQDEPASAEGTLYSVECVFSRLPGATVGSGVGHAQG